jgi:hypothetical protein
LIVNRQSTYDGIFKIIYQVIFMSDIDTEQEKLFRERYAEELRKKKQQDTYRYGGDNELVEERVKVNQQERKTPGRRGEKIKQEEIDKEIVRRDKIKNKRIPATALDIKSAIRSIDPSKRLVRGWG